VAEVNPDIAEVIAESHGGGVKVKKKPLDKSKRLNKLMNNK
jgi:hypothetical protein